MIVASNYYQQNPDGIGKTTSSRFPSNHVAYSPFLRPIDWIDRISRRLGSPALQFKKSILKEFDSSAPLDKVLGTSDEIQRLRNFVESFCIGVDNNPHLSPIGRFLLLINTLKLTKNRKKVLQHYHSNRDFIDNNGKFNRPLIITGMARSGTTLLQRLLAEDPNTRSPYTFEMDDATPPLSREANPLTDPRITSSGTATQLMTRLAPGFMEKLAESHLWSATEMEESLLYMFGHNGMGPMNGLSAGAAFMDDFLDIPSKRSIFRYERLFFTMLDAYRPARSHWTLKAPFYALFFPLIFEEYPDAKVVLTHRNPLVTLPSVCRLMETWCIAFDQDGSFDKHRFAECVRPFVSKGISVPASYRENNPEKEDSIFDCIYEELFSNPINVVQKIYRKFELEYSVEFEERMKAYLAKNRQGKYGRHKYSIQEYGFDADDLYQEFSDYMKRFNYDVVKKIERPRSFDFALGQSIQSAETDRVSAT